METKHQTIYKFLCSIPTGKVITYKTLGKFFSIHPRAVAKILSMNKQQEKFPCYKVVYSNGSVGGYNLGVEEKIHKLKEDNISVHNWKVQESHFWFPKK